jgi:hypothetical protein
MLKQHKGGIDNLQILFSLEKKLVINELGPARWNSGPGQLQTDCATRESDRVQGCGHRDGFPTNRQAIAHLAPTCGTTVAPLSLSFPYKRRHLAGDFSPFTISFPFVKVSVDILYAAPQPHGTVNVALHREYSPGVVFIFSQGRKDLYHI